MREKGGSERKRIKREKKRRREVKKRILRIKR